MRADLHIHSNYSDGTKSVKELIKLAKAKNLDMIAITDHDTIDAHIEYQHLNSDYLVIAGVELSTYRNEKAVHILGYFYQNDIDVSELKDYLKTMKEKRNIRIQKIINNLADLFNIQVEYNEVKNGSHGIIARPHIARVISEKYGYTFQEVFDNFLNDDSPAYVDIERLDTKVAIDMLHRNNAIAVLAHPIYLKDNKVEDIIALGIDGIEVRYDGQDQEHYQNLANKYNLLITGGSDYHGEVYPQEIGCNGIEGRELQKMLKRLNI